MSCAQSGISGIGTRRPDSSSSTAIASSKIALTRVVQNVIIPSTERNIVRIR